MHDRQWFDQYLDRYRQSLFESDVFHEATQFRDLALSVRDRGGKLILAGNGASAAIASHGSVDFTKQARITAINFNEADLITCFSNDYGYEQWVAQAIEFYAKPEDAVVLISSSGGSPNVVAAADTTRKLNLDLVTFTGFDEDNPLKSRGTINFWLDSRAYNIIECTHMIWITIVIDMIIGHAEYSTRQSDSDVSPS